MRDSTVHQLNALNRTFYDSIADEWHESRRAPWPGFSRVLAALPCTPARVLDIGAGDARFAEFLVRELHSPFEYLGIDSSTQLLAKAEERTLDARCVLEQVDFIRDTQWRPTRPASLITLFGVMHHVPSLALRAQLLMRFATWLAPGGCLAITFWMLSEDPRFSRRVLPWTEYNATSPTPIDETDLEPGDTLLRWGSGEAPPRYCHFANDAELFALLATSQLSLRQRFRSDGRGDVLNEYVILEASS
jgi:tRNA (uracil-5-)-methyltransferase TRM9